MNVRLSATLALCVAFLAGCAGHRTGGTPVPERISEPAFDEAELGAWGFDLSAMKTSVDPGDDFFLHANGTWLETFEIPEDEARWGAFMKLRERSNEQVRAILEDLRATDAAPGTIEQKVGDYYASFMDVEAVDARGLEPLRPLLDEIAAVTSHDELVRLFGAADRRNLRTPIRTSVGIDRKDPNRFVLNVGQGGLGLPDRAYYLEDTERFRTIRQAYVVHLAEMLALAGTEDAEKRAHEVFDLETAIAGEHWPRERLRDRDRTYNPVRIASLETEFAGFPWTRFLAAADVPASRIEEVNVTTPDVIQPLARIVRETPVETWKAYLAFHAITNHAEVLSTDVYDAHFDFFDTVLHGQPEQRPRWRRAIETIAGARDGLGEAIGRVYVERHFPPEAKRQMERLVENLRTAFRRRLRRLAWMGEDTRAEALEKLEAFDPKIAYPDVWRDFGGLTIVPDDLMANVRAMREFVYEERMARLGAPADRELWFMAPQTVNAYYNASWNEIVFPAAILQPPFFDPHADPAVNYGAIGGVIGHEMGHGFDDQGSKSDAGGVLRNWWTEADRERFEERTRALVAQFDRYEPIEGETVNGRLTLGENIGDLGGLSIAHEAYRISLEGVEPPVLDGLTGDQRFFLGWAQVWQGKRREPYMLRALKSDPHSPPEYRVNGIVRNIDAWYDAFDVEEGDALYLAPEERVDIW